MSGPPGRNAVLPTSFGFESSVPPRRGVRRREGSTSSGKGRGVIDQTEAARELAARGAPSNLVPFLMLVGRSVELIGGLALAFGIFPRVAALALIAFLVAATLVGHAFWLAAAGTPVFVGQLVNFLKNLAMMGGLLFVGSTQSQPALIRSIYARRTAGFLARKASGSSDAIASHSESRV